MRQIHYLIHCLMFLVALSSCSETVENGLTPSMDKQGGVSVVNSRLNFSTRSALNDYLTKGEEIGWQNYHSGITALQEKGFTSLIPSESDSEDRIQQWAVRKRAYLQTITPNGRDEALELEDEDPLIADPFFAALLNENHEIILGDTLFKFTQYGLFASLVADSATLQSFVKTISPSDAASFPTTGNLEKINEKISFFRPIVDQTIEINPNPGIDSHERNAAVNSIWPDPNTLNACSGSKEKWINIFGNSLDCEEYFDSDRRVKTKTWNQNFLVYSSIGISVRSQRKRFGVWWASDIEELVLGYDVAMFKYPSVSIDWPINKPRIYYEYNGKIVDQYGILIKDVWDSPKSIFTDFPIKGDEHNMLKIYYYDQYGDQKDILNWMDSDQPKVNKFVEDMVKRASMQLFKIGERLLEAKGVAIAMSSSNGDVYFINHNFYINEFNRSKCEELFDWNTGQLTFKQGFGTGFSPSPGVKPNAKSYSDARIFCYGIGRRGSVWKGNRLFFIDKK